MFRVVESNSGRERLSTAERFIESQTPGTEVLVLGTSRGAVDDFVRGVALHRGAAFGLHRFSWPQFVSQLAVPELSGAGLAPASRLGSEAIAARAAFEAAGTGDLESFQAVAEFPGFARSLSRTLSELRMAGIDDVALDQAGRSDLAKLYRSYIRELEGAQLVDWAETVAHAHRAWHRLPSGGWKGAPLLFLDPEIRSRAERDLLQDIVESSTQILATLPAGDLSTRDALQAMGGKPVVPVSGQPQDDLGRVRTSLFGDRAEPTRDSDGTIELFSAPGESREAVEIVRQIVEFSRAGVSFDQMAVFLRSPELYTAQLETAFRRAGIPAYFARGTKRPDASGRAFLALLTCKLEGLSAKRFAEYLSFSQIPELAEGGGPPLDRDRWIGPRDEAFGLAVTKIEAVARAVGSVPQQMAFDFLAPQVGEVASVSGPAVGEEPAAEVSEESAQLGGSLRAPWRWEDYLVEAAVIGGKDRWRRRLRGLERELQVKLQHAENDEPDSPRGLALRRELGHLGHLERFALPVIDLLDELPDETIWSEWLDLFEELAPRVLRQQDRVVQVLAEMRPMGSIGPVTLPEVIAVLTERLSMLERDPPSDRFGRVFVATPEDARGRSFRIVFCPGLAERLFPQRPREDPLLLDAHRPELSPELATQPDRSSDERLRLRLVVGAASEKLRVSWPRIEAKMGRPRVPSFYALDLARSSQGDLPAFEDLERANARGRLAWPSPANPAVAIDAVEHDLAVLGPLLEARPGQAQGRARYLLEMNDHLARSLRSRYARWRLKKWTPMDGIVRVTDQTRPILEQHAPKARAYSVTALQKFAACPYQFFLSAIHRLEPRDEPVALIQLDPLTRGSMIHEMQAKFLRSAADSNLLPIRQEAIDTATTLLDRVVDEVSRTYAEELAPAIERIWDDSVASIQADLRVWIRHMVNEPGDWIPQHFEWSFGLPQTAHDGTAGVADPVTILDGWQLRGAIDLIEASGAEDQFRVTDHKTGRDYTKEGWIVGGGETLQPVLYSLVVEAALGRAVPEARLAFSTSRGGFTERRFAINDFARLYGKQALEAIENSILAGAMPPAPKEGKCAYCDFRSVCGPLEEQRWALKDSALVQPLLHLRELP